LITLFVTAFFISPLYASGDPWDGTKVTDTLSLSNGGIIKDVEDDEGIGEDGDGDDTPALKSIIEWIKSQITSDKKDRKANIIRKNKGKIHHKMNSMPKTHSYSKE
jgi:hypothetical protein